MSNKQSIKSTISGDLKLLHDKAVASYRANHDQQALSYSLQALHQIESIGDTTHNIRQFQYQIFLLIYFIHFKQQKITLANEFINKALQAAQKLQEQDKIAQCLDERGKIKILERDHEGALFDFKRSVEIKLEIDGDKGLNVSHSYNNIGDVYNDQGKYDDAMSMYKKSLKIQLKAPGDNRSSYAETYHNIGNVFYNQGKYDNAIRFYEKSLEDKSLVLGDNHPSIANTYNSIGSVYYQQGKYDDAVNMYERSLKIDLLVLGDDHPRIANTYNNMGSTYQVQGKYDSAISLYNKSLKIQLSTLDGNHPSIANTYNGIGVVYKDQGKYDDAVSMYNKSLKIKLSSLGDNHSSTADTYNNIGLVYDAQGKYDDAISIYEKSLQIKLSVLGDNHPRTADTYHNMGMAYDNQGKYDDAISMYKKSLEIKLSTLGNNHSSTADTYQNLGAVYYAQGKYDDAVSMFKKSLQIKLLTFGNNHPSIAHTYSNIGNIYMEQGKYNDAVSMYNKSLKIDLLLGDNHPSIADTYHNMGSVYCKQGKYDDAISMYEKSLNIKLSLLGDNHPSVANTYSNIGSVYAIQGKIDDAIVNYKKSFKIQLPVLGDNHPSIAEIYSNMGSIYSQQGKYDDAMSMLHKSLKIESSALGDNHPRIADTYNNIGLVYARQGKYNDAISMHEKSLGIQLSVLGDNHPSIADTYDNMGFIYTSLGRYDDAVSYYERAITILTDAHLQNHPHLAKIYNNIANCYDKQNRHNDAIAMRQRSNDIRRSSRQVNTISQTPTNVIDQVQAPQGDVPAHDDITAKLSDQQIQSQQITNSGDNHSDSDDNSHKEHNHDQALREKQYFSAYTEALERGSCKNKVIRAMYAGPECVGKSSIMKVFTQQNLVHHQDATQVVDQSDIMVHVEVYKIKDRTTCDLRQIWDNNVHEIVQERYENQDKSQQMSTLMPQLTGEYLSINDQHPSIVTQSITVNQDTTVATLASSHSSTISPTGNDFSLQQRPDFFQHYYTSWLNKTVDDSQYAKLWDFGGQSLYHVTHQPFLSGNSIYFLVFNIDKNIDDRVVTRDKRLINATYLQSMQEWLTSIIGCNASQNGMTTSIDGDNVHYSLPIVILVASHGDCITSKQQGIDQFEKFEQELITKLPRYKSNIYSSRIIFNCNPNDNSNDTLEERKQCSLRLHKIMKSFVQSLPFMSNPIPIRWYIMATILHTPTDNNDNEFVLSYINQVRATRVHKIMTIQEIQSLAQDLGLYEGDDKLIAMLSYLHDLGEIIFCRQDDTIVTDVDWLLRIFRAIIRLHNCPSGNLDMKSLYNEASQTGKISTKYIDYVLAPYKLEDETKKSIITLMESYDILCMINSDNDQDESHYFVPYLLRSDVKPFDLTKYHISDTLYIGYEHNDIPYIPDGIYYCLLSSCLKQWNNINVELYYQCAKFYLASSRHYIIIKKDGSHIALQYCYQKLDNPKSANIIKSAVRSSIYNDRPHDIIKEKLSLLIKDRMPKFKASTLRYYVRCCECNNLTYLEDNSEPQNENLIQCRNQSCNTLFESRTMNDWIYSNQEYDNDRKQVVELPTHKGIHRKYFDIIASELDGNSLFRLGIKLNVPDNVVNEICNSNTVNYQKTYRILRLWQDQVGQHADLNDIITILRDMNKNAIAEDVMEEANKRI